MRDVASMVRWLSWTCTCDDQADNESTRKDMATEEMWLYGYKKLNLL